MSLMLTNSSLLYTRADGTEAFVHDTLGDYFLAEWFIRSINSGQLSIEDALLGYLNHYNPETTILTEDEFELLNRHVGSHHVTPIRYLPGLENTLLFLFELGGHDSIQELVEATHSVKFTLKDRIKFLDLFAQEKVIDMDFYVSEFLAISKLIFEEHGGSKEDEHSQMPLYDNLRDTLFKFVYDSDELTENYLKLVRVISQEIESSPEGLRSFYARALRFIKPREIDQTRARGYVEEPLPF